MGTLVAFVFTTVSWGAMERDSDSLAGGGPSAPVNVDDQETDSWDRSFAFLKDAGLDAHSDLPNTSEPGEPSIADLADIGGIACSSNAFASFNFQNTLRHASLERATSLPSLPWEVDAWKYIFQDDHDPLDFLNVSRALADPPIPVSQGGAEQLVEDLVTEKKRARPLPSGEPFFKIAVGHRQDVAWEEKREADMQRGLFKWISIIHSWPEHWKASKELSACETMDGKCEVLAHYFSGKAPSTLVKRANSLIFIMEQAHKLGYFFPLTESELYSLLKTLRTSGTKCSRLKGVLEALTLCRHTFSLDDMHELITSRRCFGAIASGPVEKANQAAPLRVSDLVALHEILEGAGDLWDKAMAGACLFCVYSRARWSDFIHGGTVEVDRHDDGRVAYVEMLVGVHKTMFASARRFRFLNLAAPGRGVHGGDWVSSWFACLVALNIDPFAKDHGCLMPAPDCNGVALKRAIDTDEAGGWLRLLLGEALNKADCTRSLSSHSLKSTMLSFAAKRGVSHPDRLSLGHHAHPFKMADVYARDAQARDLRILDSLIEEIRSGSFVPDASRAGRVISSKKQRTDDPMEDDLDDYLGDLQREKVHEELFPADGVEDGEEQDEDTGGHVTTDSSSDSSSDGEREVVAKQFLPPKAPDGFKFLKHQKSKLLHYIQDGYLKTLACGRNRSAAYVEPGELRYDSAVCHACQRAVLS